MFTRNLWSGMTPQRDVDEEQAFLDLAYASLDAMRRDAEGLRDSVLDLGRGGTFQSRTERDIVVRGALARLAQLDVCLLYTSPSPRDS